MKTTFKGKTQKIIDKLKIETHVLYNFVFTSVQNGLFS